VQQSRSKRARRNPSPRMIKVTVHEKRRVNEEQPTPTSSPSRNHDSAAPKQHQLICTGAEPIQQVHGPPKPRATESMLRNRIHISAIFPPFRMETWNSLRMMSDRANIRHYEHTDFVSGFGARHSEKAESVLELGFLREPHAPTVKLACVQFQGRPWRALR